MKHNWKNVPIPDRMKDLPKDPRGFPIPANILKDDAGVYHFIINDEKKRAEQIEQRRCAICDGKIPGLYWFVGGPMSALHPQGAYIDTAQHYECVTYALQVCPYLATRPYHRPDVEKVCGRVQSENTVLFVDPTMIPDQPNLFVLVGAEQFDEINGGQYVKPRDIVKIEAWLDGRRLDRIEDQDLIMELLPDMGQLLIREM